MKKLEKNALGVDIGGTKLAIGIVSEYGAVVDKTIVHDHVKLSDIQIIEYIYHLSCSLLKRNKLQLKDMQGVGVCFPGHLNFKTGFTITTSNLKGFKNFPLKKELESFFNINVVVDNDANLQAYGENKYGAGMGFEDMIFVTISSGIGAGLILNGKLYRGMSGTAGEVGHMIIDSSSENKCTCGNRGCWMACAGGIALTSIAKKYLEKNVVSKIVSQQDILNNKIDGKVLSRGIKEKDELCIRIVSDFSNYIAIGLYNIFQIFNVPLIVLGGGLLNLGEEFFCNIKNRFFSLTGDMLAEETAIEKIKLGEDSGIIGGASVASHK